MSIDPKAPAPLAEARFFLRQELTGPQPIALGGGRAVVYTAPRDSGKPNEDGAALIPTGEDHCLLVVADGMGGAKAGDLATEILLGEVSSAVAAAGPAPSAVRNAVLDGVEKANREILGLDVRAGATVAMAEISGNRLRTYHAGDSMVVLFGSGGLPRWKTVSHSPVGYAVASGFFKEQQAIRHESLHLLSNAIGMAGMRLEVGSSAGFERGDTLLIASDGLFDNMLMREIGETLRGPNLLEAVSELVATVAQRMSAPSMKHPSKPDDLTLLAFRPENQEELRTLAFRAVDHEETAY